ncbi:MAG TPA: J domain-containing protein [Sorangium sp.]|nr:J domain-containing protein [Sorangium sp.]
MTTARKLYQQLGVQPTATDAEIRSAYKKLARKFHPDRNQKNGAEQRFKDIGNAYQVLSDPTKRKLYDEFGELALQAGFDEEQAQRVRQHRAYQRQGVGRRARSYNPTHFETYVGSNPSWRGAVGRSGGVNLEDLLRGFAGAAGAQAHGSSNDRSRMPTTKPTDVYANVTLAFVDAAKGAEMMLEVPTGDADNGVRRQRVRIPAGTADGTVLRLRGQGRRSPHHDKAGDLLLTVKVLPHKVFSRDGLDLHMSLPVDLLETYEGTTLSVPTLDGTVTLRVPPRSQPGTKLRLRGQGVRRGANRGDLIVELDVRMPDKQDPAIVEALRRTRSGYRKSPRADDFARI